MATRFFCFGIMFTSILLVATGSSMAAQVSITAQPIPVIAKYSGQPFVVKTNFLSGSPLSNVLIGHSIVTAGGARVDHRYVKSNLTAGIPISVTYSQNIPSDLPLGTYSIVAFAYDSKNQKNYAVKLVQTLKVIAVPTEKKKFGFVGIACGTNYANEVGSYTNIAHMCANDPVDMSATFNSLKVNGLKAFLDVSALLFYDSKKIPLGGSGANMDLRPDYKTRWNNFVSLNKKYMNLDYLAGIYPIDEPTWQGTTTTELKTVASMIKASFPTIPLILIEADGALNNLIVPTEFDWIGFDFYGAIDPRTNTDYQDHLKVLKSKMTRANQKILLVFDAQWYSPYGDAGFTPESMATFAQNYYSLMISDPKIIGMIGYAYFGGIDAPGQLGARDLPRVVQDKYRQLGKIITGKP